MRKEKEINRRNERKNKQARRAFESGSGKVKGSVNRGARKG